MGYQSRRSLKPSTRFLLKGRTSLEVNATRESKGSAYRKTKANVIRQTRKTTGLRGARSAVAAIAGVRSGKVRHHRQKDNSYEQYLPD